MFTVKDIVQVTDSGLTAKAFHKTPSTEDAPFRTGLRDLTYLAEEYTKAAKMMDRVCRQATYYGDMTIEDMIKIYYPNDRIFFTDRTKTHRVYRVGRLFIHAKIAKQ